MNRIDILAELKNLQQRMVNERSASQAHMEMLRECFENLRKKLSEDLGIRTYPLPPIDETLDSSDECARCAEKIIAYLDQQIEMPLQPHQINTPKNRTKAFKI